MHFDYLSYMIGSLSFFCCATVGTILYYTIAGKLIVVMVSGDW